MYPRFRKLLVGCAALLWLPSGVQAQQCAAYVSDQITNDLLKVDLTSGAITLVAAGFADPQAVVLDAAGTTAFVVERGSGELSSLDLATGAITTIATGLDSPYGVALNGAETSAFVTERTAGTILAVDLGSGAATTLVTGLVAPEAFVVNSAETLAYVLRGSPPELSSVDLATSAVTVITSALSSPSGLTLNVVETAAYVTESASGELSLVDLATGGITLVASGLNLPRGVTLNPDGTIAYVAEQNGKIAAVDIGPSGFAGTTVTVVTGLASPYGLTISPTGDQLLATSTVTDDVLTVALSGGFFGGLADLATGLTNPEGIAVNAAGTLAYVTGNGELSRADLLTGAITTVASGLSGPSGVRLNVGETSAFVVETSTGELSSIDLATGIVTLVASGLGSPFGLVLNGAQTKAYVTEFQGDQLYAVDLPGGTATTIATGFSGPLGLVLEPAETTALVLDGALLLAVDLTTGAATTVATSLSGRRVDLDAAGTTAFVTELQSRRVSSIDLATGTRTTIASGLDRIRSLDFNAATSLAFITISSSGPSVPGKVQALDLSTSLVNGTAVSSAGLSTVADIALNAAETTALVTESTSGELSAVDLNTGLVTVLASGLNSPWGVAWNAAETSALVTESQFDGFFGNSLSEIDLATGQRTIIASALKTPLGVALNSAETVAFVVEQTGNKLSAVNLEAGFFFGSVTSFGFVSLPTAITLNADESAAFVTSSLGTLVSMGIDPAEPGFGIATTVASGLSFPLGVSLNTAETTAFVTDAGTGDLVAVDLVTGIPSPVVNLDGPTGLALSGLNCPVQVVSILPSAPVAGTGSRIAACLVFDMSGAPDLLGAYDVTLQWDPSGIQYLDAFGGDVPFDSPVVDASNVAGGSLGITDSDPIGAGGNVFAGCMEFALVGPAGSLTSLDLELTSLTAAVTGDDLLPTAIANDATIEVRNCLIGDVSGDLSVNSGDALLLLSNEVGLPIPAVTVDAAAAGCGDANDDGVTDSIDANIVLSFEVELPINPSFPIGNQNQVTDSCATTCAATAEFGSRATEAAGREEKVLSRLRTAPVHPLPDEEFEVVLEVDMGSRSRALGSYTARLSWNPGAAEFLEIAEGGASVFRAPAVNLAKVANGQLRLTAADPRGKTGEVELVRLRFRALRALPPVQLGKVFNLRYTSLGTAGPWFEDLLPLLESASSSKRGRSRRLLRRDR